MGAIYVVPLQSSSLSLLCFTFYCLCRSFVLSPHRKLSLYYLENYPIFLLSFLKSLFLLLYHLCQCEKKETGSFSQLFNGGGAKNEPQGPVSVGPCFIRILRRCWLSFPIHPLNQPHPIVWRRPMKWTASWDELSTCMDFPCTQFTAVVVLSVSFSFIHETGCSRSFVVQVEGKWIV